MRAQRARRARAPSSAIARPHRARAHRARVRRLRAAASSSSRRSSTARAALLARRVRRRGRHSRSAIGVAALPAWRRGRDRGRGRDRRCNGTRRAMAPRIAIIGGGSYQWVPKLLVDVANTPSLARRRDRARTTSTPRRSRGWPSWVERIAERPGHRALSATATTDQRDALERRRLRRGHDLDRRVREHAPRPRDPGAVRDRAERRRHRRPGRDHPGAAQHPGASSSIARDMEERLPRRVDAQPHQPDDHDLPGGDP